MASSNFYEATLAEFSATATLAIKMSTVNHELAFSRLTSQFCWRAREIPSSSLVRVVGTPIAKSADCMNTNHKHDKAIDKP